VNGPQRLEDLRTQQAPVLPLARFDQGVSAWRISNQIRGPLFPHHTNV
jgi:hypothetical protein